MFCHESRYLVYFSATFLGFFLMVSYSLKKNLPVRFTNALDMLK